MKKSRFTETQIVSILKQADAGMPVKDICRQAGIDDVREAAHWWMIDYNEQRPHDSLGDLTPCEYAQRFAGGSTSEMPA